MVIAFVSQKGGGGKTTLAINLAGELAKRGKTLFVDTDRQASARDWNNFRDHKPFVLSKWTTANLAEFIANRPQYEFVVLDTPSGVAEIAKSAMNLSDLVIIPIQPSALDVWSADATIRVLSGIEKTPKAVCAINRKVVNAKITESAKAALAKYELPLLKAEIAQRVAFAECIALGLTVGDMQPRGKAAQEMRAFAQEILSML